MLTPNYKVWVSHYKVRVLHYKVWVPLIKCGCYTKQTVGAKV